MGTKQSKRSVDITTTPKKEGIPAEGGVVVGDAAAPGDGKLERIEESDTKPTSNGIAPHTDAAENKDKDKEEQPQEEVKAEEAKPESAGESPAETAEVTTPTEATPASPNTATSPESKETKKKDKPKKKWSFRSISFSKKDKSKPAREEAPKNGDVTKEEPLAEGGEEAENVSATAGSPAEEKSAVSSPSAENDAAPAATPSAEAKEEVAVSAASSPAEEKKEEPTPSAPTPVPVEDKKEEVEKVEAEKKVVEVSPAGGQFIVDPVEVSVFRVQPVATPSIIERKTSEDIPSQPPSSPPPTPIDPSPLQQAQQAAATVTALAEALKLPAEAADKESAASTTLSSSDQRPADLPESSTESFDVSSQPLPTDKPLSEPTLLPAKVEALPVVEKNKDTDNSTLATKQKKAELEPLPVVDSVAKSPVIPVNESTPLVQSKDGEKCQIAVSVIESKVKSCSDNQALPVIDNEAKCSVKSCEIKVEEKVEVLLSKVVGQPKEVEMLEEPFKSKVVPETDTVPSQSPEIVGESVKSGPLEAEEFTKTEVLVEEVAEEDVANEETESIGKEPSVEQPESEFALDSEEGPVPVSVEILVEAKPAVIIPEDDAADTDADISKVDTESVEVIADTEEDKAGNETESEAALPTEETFILDEPEDLSVPCEMTIETSQPINETIAIIENPVEGETTLIEIAEVEEPLPPPVPESPVPSLQETSDLESISVKVEPIKVPSPVETSLLEAEESPVVSPVPQESSSLRVSESPTSSVHDKETSLVNDCQTHLPTSRLLEDVSVSSDDLPPAPQDTVECFDSSDYPLPPEELSCPLVPSNVFEIKSSELPVPVDSVSSLRNPTETILTPPRSPSPQSNVSIASGITASTKDCSQTQLRDDQSNREFKMESVSISLNSYNESDIELKERLAESLAETEIQEESLSCQLSNNALSTAAQETHQSTPEAEVPVENNVAHDVSTTESSDDAPKVAPPAVPTEAPASPPSAPAITEDVASVTKAIEEIDISDKAVAAATIECNTNEIIADAHHQNNINE